MGVLNQQQESHLLEQMEKDIPSLLKLLQHLIHCEPCYLGNGSGIEEAQHLIRQELESYGFEVKVVQIDTEVIRQHPAYVQVEKWGEHFVNYVPGIHSNLVARIVFNDVYPTLALNGHVDVEPIHDPHQWYMPEAWKSGSMLDNKLYGRGSADMLGGMAGMLFVLKHLLSAGVSLKTNLLFHSVSDEEIGGNGTLQCLLQGPRPDFALIAEPTSLNICRASLGFHHFQVNCRGTPIHMSQASTQQSAIDIAFLAYQHLQQLGPIISQTIRRHRDFQDSGLNPLIFGRIHGGEDPAIPATTCLLEGVVFSAPQQTRSEIEKMLVAKLPNALAATASVTNMSFPGAAEDNAPVVQALYQAMRQLTIDTHIQGFASPCDMRLYSNFGVPSTIFGPGHLAQAHAPDEYISINDLFSFCKILFLTLIHLNE